LNLDIKDLSNLLMLNSKQIKQLIKDAEIPSIKLNDKIVFNKHQVIEWALGKNFPINLHSSEKFAEYKVESLTSLIDEKSFHYDCNLTETDYITQMVGLLNLEKVIDTEIIIQVLKSREDLMSTAIGNGIALPHPRIPIIIDKNKPLVHLFFPMNKLDLNSIDGKPIHTLILLISQTVKQHLSVVAHLSFLLSKEAFRFALENRLHSQEIVSISGKIEEARI